MSRKSPRKSPRKIPAKNIAYSSFFVLLFCSVLLLAVWLGRLPLLIVGIYLAASMIAFIAYYLDKMAAKNNRWRTQESTLHLFSLFGGWPGALLAQKILRHKSNKPAFLTVFWISVFINCMLLAWLLPASAAAMLTRLFDLAS